MDIIFDNSYTILHDFFENVTKSWNLSFAIAVWAKVLNQAFQRGDFAPLGIVCGILIRTPCYTNFLDFHSRIQRPLWLCYTAIVILVYKIYRDKNSTFFTIHISSPGILSAFLEFKFVGNILMISISFSVSFLLKLIITKLQPHFHLLLTPIFVPPKALSL